jgi:hypothetical protein
METQKGVEALIYSHENILLLIFSIITVVITGCTSHTSINIPSPSVTKGISTPVITVTSIPPFSDTSTLTSEIFTPVTTRTIVPTQPTLTQTMEPTLTEAESEERILELLKTNGNCKLPCFWGIVPGKTTWPEVQQLFLHLGADIVDYIPRMYRNTDIKAHYIYSDVPAKQLGINAGVFEANDQIDSMRIDLSGAGFAANMQRFFFKEVLLELGEPTQVWMSLGTGSEAGDAPYLGYNFWLFYEQIGLVVEYGGAAQKINTEYRVCPNQPHFVGGQEWQEGSGNISFVMQSPENTRPLPDLVRGTSEEFGFTRTIEEAASLSPKDFYKLITLGNEPACFDTPRDIWP